MAIITPTLLAIMTIGVVALISGILIGSYILPPSIPFETQQKLDLLNALTETHYSGADDQIVQHIIDDVNADNIRNNLKFLSSEPHLAGSSRDEELAAFIKDSWLDQGLDEAFMVPYNVLLSFSNLTNPNKIEIIDGSGKTIFSSRHQEQQIRNDTSRSEFGHAYHGYAPNGSVIGEPVYCNYGRLKDFDLLENYAKINLTGKICIIRYGKLYRGNKCENAAKRNCVGCILYSDPHEIARDGIESEKLYPNTWWMPGSAMQRGNMKMGMGDPLTPGFPAIDRAFRFDFDDIQLPKIPSQPIGYDDALQILKIMGGIPVPNTPEFQDWKGGLNITYMLGPGFNYHNFNKKLRLKVNNQLKQKTVYNVIGVLKGSLEADRYVILGNHRDSWGFGALDASSGTAALLEVTRVFGKLHKEHNWTPRRTMIFCSWGAEEFGLIGSTEWVEHHIHLLSQRTAAYINVDTCISGPHFSPDASPSLMSILRSVSSMVPYIPHSNKSIYESWEEHQSNFLNDFDTTRVKVNTLGSGTDHAPFAFYAGIPSINIEFIYDKKKYPIGSYPAYHTGYETYYLVDRIIDPGFSLHLCCTRLLGVLIHAIAQSTFLPFDFQEFADRVRDDFYDFITGTNYKAFSKNQSFNNKTKDLIDMLDIQIRNFIRAADEWNSNLKKVNLNNPVFVRQMNDLMIGFERIFIKPEGLDERAQIRHVLYAPFKYDTYSKGAFPGVKDLMYKISHSNDKNQIEHNLKLLRKHLSDVALIIKSAARFLTGRTF